MKTILKGVVAAGMLLLLFAAPYAASPAMAGAPATSSGTFQVVGFEVTASRFVGGVAFYSATNTIELSGSLSGTLVCDEHQIITPNDFAVIRDTCIFTGSFEGRTGTVVFGLVSTVAGPDAVSKGHTVVRRGGTGELADLRGAGTFAANPDGSGTYAGSFRFRG